MRRCKIIMGYYEWSMGLQTPDPLNHKTTNGACQCAADGFCVIDSPNSTSLQRQ
jgi:hypothetical protein